ncbi:MAG: hypothetical protein OEL77_03015 [Nitrosopumilus sp.]|nr:hypothetical protein [Nitrosopumilus sp.]
MSPENQKAFLEKYAMNSDHTEKMDSDHKDQLKAYCLLDEAGRQAHFDEHRATMKDKISDHKDTMKDKISDHKDTMKDKISDHKDTMKDKISDHKTHMVLRASALTDEQKAEVKAMHMELRNFKHSLKSNSTDLDKEEIRNQFMEKAKEFSMAWLSPRHQIAAGIDAQMVECRDGFSLVMKISNEKPICVKESTAEKLIERGIATSAT